MEPWASVRAVNPLVETEGAVGGLASSLTSDLVNLQELVRDLMAALSRKSVSAGSNLLVVASQSGKRRRDQVTPKSDSDSDDSVFRKGSSSNCMNRVEKVARENPGAFFGQELAEISPSSWDAGERPHIGRLCADAGIPEQHLPWTALDEGRRDLEGPGDANVGVGNGRPHKWPPPSGGRSPHATLQGGRAGRRPTGLDAGGSFGVGSGIRRVGKLGGERGGGAASDPSAQIE